MTSANQAAAKRVTYQLETLWDYDYEPTHDELSTLYETAKKNQRNGSTAIDWSRPVGTEGPGALPSASAPGLAEGSRDPDLGVAPLAVPARRAGRARGLRP